MKKQIKVVDIAATGNLILKYKQDHHYSWTDFHREKGIDGTKRRMISYAARGGDGHCSGHYISEIAESLGIETIYKTMEIEG